MTTILNKLNKEKFYNIKLLSEQLLSITFKANIQKIHYLFNLLYLHNKKECKLKCTKNVFSNNIILTKVSLFMSRDRHKLVTIMKCLY